jgi:hypothetical protein
MSLHLTLDESDVQLIDTATGLFAALSPVEIKNAAGNGDVRSAIESLLAHKNLRATQLAIEEAAQRVHGEVGTVDE